MLLGGGPPVITTTSVTLEQRKQCIPWAELPKTFQDAITITRGLNVRYIWIDALCIIQDDQSDWETEASKMSLVYQNSYLNIAASHASDGTVGCFHSTPGVSADASLEIPGSSGVRVRVSNRQDHADFSTNWNTTAKSPPLHRRCWVMQERLLSPRVIYYMATELVWECNTQCDCQCKVIHAIERFKPTYSQSLRRTPGCRPLSHQWMRVLERYTSQNVSYVTDRLPALSGLARQAQDAGLGQYAAGLWRQDFGHLACWIVESKRTSKRSDTYLGPTWSWVNIFGKIGYPNRMDFWKQNSLLVEVDDLSVTTGSDPTGRVLASHLVISGWSIDATLHITAETGGGQSYTLNTDTGDVYSKFLPDTPIRNLQHPYTRLKVKLVSWTTLWRAEPHTQSLLFMVIH